MTKINSENFIPPDKHDIHKPLIEPQHFVTPEMPIFADLSPDDDYQPHNMAKIREDERKASLDFLRKKPAELNNKFDSSDIQELWEKIKVMEIERSEYEQQLTEIRATMLLNYGPKGKCISNVIGEEHTTISMVIKVFEYYHKEISNSNKIFKDKLISLLNITFPDDN